MTSVNGNENPNDDVDANDVQEGNLLDKEGTEFENKIKYGGDFYVFNQRRKKFKCKNDVTSLYLKGSVVRYDGVDFKKEYNFIITENQTASCVLEKKGDSTTKFILKELEQLLLINYWYKFLARIYCVYQYIKR